ncbi:MAG: glycogen debranching protein GlgX [Myxococcota bacterium]
MRVWPGRPTPLGASYDGFGTNFAIYTGVASRVELCLFDASGQETRIELPERHGYVWHGYLPDVRPGQHYGYRVHGPYDLSSGMRCNPQKLLIDPYAKAIAGRVKWGQEVFGYTFGDPFGPPNALDSAAHMPKSVVIDPYFDWSGDVNPQIPLHETVIYEAHVKGLTMQHPALPEEMRGTYLGLTHPAILEHLAKLGVTAIELMPVHHFVHDQHLLDQGLRNYWGYNSIGYLAPHDEYARSPRSQDVVNEFKQMVKVLHRVGIEVILDVVYNHTAEGNHLGPTLSLKGIDNAHYYRLVHDDRRYYFDYTGTGNTLNMRHPYPLRLMMDSLRYWILEMHVDGFRFDLASTLARGLHDVDRLSAFFELIQQDPVINQVKLIAEPWDVGEGGYQVGEFPPQWSEWNGRYRDWIRDFWLGQRRPLAELGYRITGSSDLYAETGRRPYASINFATAHDGFTLRDLVSYNEKHNLANGEQNQDGANDNRSWNHGAEGPTDNAWIVDLRTRQRKNILTTLMLSQGMPMLLAGDELGRTQHGNNNAYGQDNPVSWVDWANVDEPFLDFVQRLVALRNAHPTFRRRHFFHGRTLMGTDVRDVHWFAATGREMTDADWWNARVLTVGIYLNGDAIAYRDERGQPVVDDHFLVVLHAGDESVEFVIPSAEWASSWTVALSSFPDLDGHPDRWTPGQALTVPPRTVVVLTHAVDR